MNIPTVRMRYNLLLVDNDPVFIETCAEYLESAGFKVYTAASPAEAREKLESLWLHLAVVDVRLTNEIDPNDTSGLLLAQDMACVLPTLILTRYRDNDAMYRILKFQDDGRQRVMDYIDKRRELPELLQAIQNILKLEKSINTKLKIDWKTCDRFGLISLMEPGLEPGSLADRSEELEGLFRKIFQQDSIRIQRMLWNSPGCAALVVFAFDDISAPESFLVTCGQKARIEVEAQNFAEFSPKGNTEAGTALINKASTIHFAANVYALTGNDLEEGNNLADLYRTGMDKIFHTALENLFHQRLRAWHQGKRILLKPQSSGHPLVGLVKSISEEDFTGRVEGISELTSTVGLEMKRAAGRLLVRPALHGCSYPDPLPSIQKWASSAMSDLVIKVPGNINGENVLADNNGQAWLTHFGEAGLAPAGWNYANLETAIRFDWLDMTDLNRRFELELCLLNSDFTNPDTRDLDPACRKAAHAISLLRKLYVQDPDHSIQSYQGLLFLQTTQRLLAFDPAAPLISVEIARMGHILLSLAMIAAGLDTLEEKAGESISMELKLKDPDARVFQIGAREVHLSSQPFNLLHYLYKNADRICKHEELVENVLEGKYDDAYLHALIGRIRKALGEDADHPNYLFTIPGVGYRLTLKK
jgi:DNA-binding response OmpR family regulator